MSSNHLINIILNDLDLELSFPWSYSEYPQKGDSISIIGLCSEVQKNEFEQMPLPRYIQSDDFQNVLEYLSYYEWVVTHRSWGYCDGCAVICSPSDPLL